VLAALCIYEQPPRKDDMKVEVLASEIHVLELNGYLNALRCMVGHQYSKFCAGLIEKSGRTIDEVIDERIKNILKDGEILERRISNFKNVQKLLKSHIYSKIPNSNDAVVDYIDWNLIEYYGLISTAEDENGPWNRLVSQDSHIIEYVEEDKTKSVVFFVEHEEFVVATYL
jgi:hypothetical protein